MITEAGIELMAYFPFEGWKRFLLPKKICFKPGAINEAKMVLTVTNRRSESLTTGRSGTNPKDSIR